MAVSAALLPQQLANLQQLCKQQPGSGSDASTSVLITHGSQDKELSRAKVEATVTAAEALGEQDCDATLAHCASCIYVCLFGRHHVAYSGWQVSAMMSRLRHAETALKKGTLCKQQVC